MRKNIIKAALFTPITKNRFASVRAARLAAAALAAASEDSGNDFAALPVLPLV